MFLVGRSHLQQPRYALPQQDIQVGSRKPVDEELVDSRPADTVPSALPSLSRFVSKQLRAHCVRAMILSFPQYSPGLDSLRPRLLKGCKCQRQTPSSPLSSSGS